ncbi:MAG: transglutaminase-like domain-containing protein [Candidatus Nealsonbacteria bacterium]
MENQVIAVVPSKEKHIFTLTQDGSKEFKKPVQALAWLAEQGNGSRPTVLAIMGGAGQEFFTRLVDADFPVKRIPIYQLQQKLGVEPKASQEERASALMLFLKDIFGDKVNLIASENPNIFLGNDIGQHLFDISWMNCQPMINKVNELTAGRSTDYEKAKSVINWLANSRQYGEPSPLTAGKNMCESFSVSYGICHDSAYIGVAMLRLAGIPSRVIGPVKGARHNYVEFYSDGKWYGIDGTFCQPCGGERFALERSTLLTNYQILKFNQPKELISLEGWKGNYTDRTFQYSVKSIILITISKKNLLAQNEKTDWGELTYIKPFYEIANSRIMGAKVVAKNLYCDVYECSQSQEANQEISLPFGGNILVAGDRITYQNGKKTGEINNITAEPFLFEDFYITTTLPPGQYRFWYDAIAFVDININPGEKVTIQPESLIKSGDITNEQFNNFINYLKTVK